MEPVTTPRHPLRELVEPFVHFARAPKALWGVNSSYFIEGLCYFGILTLLAIYFNEIVALDDAQAGWVLGAFTGGITLAMFFFGELADRWGVRTALMLALILMVAGRILLTLAPGFGGTGFGSPVFLSAAGGLLLVVLGYGMYQPAAYSAVRQFTNATTAPMAYAMLYALMNLGSFVAGLVSPRVRGSFGIEGIYWVYTALTVVSVLLVAVLMTRAAMQRARSIAGGDETGTTKTAEPKTKTPFDFIQWLREHPLRDIRFSFFIFVLIPVQTLFAHQWLTMPQYTIRAYPGWVAENMETFVNLNPLLIFVLTPIIAAATVRANVYRMMILGTFVMALPTFLLALGPNVITLFAYIVIVSVGEAMWQPRFLQLAAELAPEGKTGMYMGIAQFPWFLTKVLTSLYSGTMLAAYCPESGPLNTEMLWLIYGGIAMASPLGLFIAQKWMGNRLQGVRGQG